MRRVIYQFARIVRLLPCVHLQSIKRKWSNNNVSPYFDKSISIAISTQGTIYMIDGIGRSNELNRPEMLSEQS